MVEQVVAICTNLKQTRLLGTDYLVRSVRTACRRSKKKGTADVALQRLDGMGSSDEEGGQDTAAGNAISIDALHLQCLAFLHARASFSHPFSARSQYFSPTLKFTPSQAPFSSNPTPSTCSATHFAVFV